MALFRRTHAGSGDQSGVLARLAGRLGATRQALSQGIGRLLSHPRPLDASLVEDLEAALIGADLGIEATATIIADLSRRIGRHEINDAPAVYAGLRTILIDILTPCAHPWPTVSAPQVVLMVGVNGAGKTTTVGKMAARFGHDGRTVMMAAADTFRAAAIEQLAQWAEHTGATLISQPRGADAAAVAHDALQAARARQTDILLIDTAGRLHTQTGLMDELAKIRRVLARIDAHAPHEIILVLDGSIGQNAITQLEQFHKAVGITGLCITKLDGTARGGVLFAMAQRMRLPIYFIGIGEGEDDLRPFDPQTFVDAILPPTIAT